MKLTDLIEIVIRTPSGGIMTDENKLDRDFTALNIHQASATSKIKWYEQKGSVHDLWYQTFVPHYEPLLQTTDDCLAIFQCPPVINLSSCQDGFGYVGTQDGLHAYRRWGQGPMQAMYAGHPVTNRMGVIYYWWEYENGMPLLKTKGRKNLQPPLVRGIFANPLDVPTFREEYDQYPITEELIPLIRQELFNLQTKIVVMQRADTISDSQSTTQP